MTAKDDVETARELGRLTESVRQLEVGLERGVVDAERAHTRLREDMQVGFRDVTQAIQKASAAHTATIQALTVRVNALERWRSKANGAARVIIAVLGAAGSIAFAWFTSLWPTAQHGAGK